MKNNRIGILGLGTWGIALGRMLAINGYEVEMWSALPEEVEFCRKNLVHPKLENIRIPDSIEFTTDIKKACDGKSLIIFAVPSIFVRSTAKKATPYISKEQIIVDVAKGIEADTLKTMSEVIEEEIGRGIKVVALSGPTHAEEVAVDLPTTIVSACEDTEISEAVQDVFMNTCLRVYTNSDKKGVELCAAMKNIIALAAGISDGIGYGDNAKAAIITRGMAEITRLGTAMGCKAETFFGLAGIGDLIVTSTSKNSRNNRAGFLIGRGMSPDKAKEKVGMVVEGINALPAAIELSKKYSVELPITMAVNSVINNGADPIEMVKKLMQREKKKEF